VQEGDKDFLGYSIFLTFNFFPVCVSHYLGLIGIRKWFMGMHVKLQILFVKHYEYYNEI
jgi:hypothetical protein